jgi:uncharacterized protein
MTDMTQRRIQEIDVVRGLALAGLPLVNIPLTVGEDHYPHPGAVSAFIYHHLVYQHFLTIFCFLFGVSFALILDTASARTPRPRLVLARRLVALFVISMFQAFALDHNLQLAVYATLGLLVLLPVSYLPRRAHLLVGIALLVASMPIIEVDPETAGNPVKILLEWSALLVLGAATVRYGIHADLTRRTRQLAVALPATAVLALTLGLLDADRATMLGSALGEIQLLSTCAAYVTGLLLLLRTGLRSAVTTALAPIGRMALTCFLTQAAAAVAFATLVDVQAWNYALLTFGGTAVLIAAQSIACTWWLRHYRYGPFEWLWRCATWLTVVPIRRTAAAAVA